MGYFHLIWNTTPYQLSVVENLGDAEKAASTIIYPIQLATPPHPADKEDLINFYVRLIALLRKGL